MIVFLNPHCSYGTGRSRWDSIKKELHSTIGEFRIEEILSPDSIVDQVSKAIQTGEHTLVAAGGDGTVNLLLNAIMITCTDSSRITIGAVGLGSSNDFHKPFRKEAFIREIPVRINSTNASPCDVIRIDYQDVEGREKTHFCLVNSSIGITAEANALFNAQPKFVRLFRTVSVNAAIVAAALKTILTYRSISCQLAVGDREPEILSITNLGIIKMPHFAGSFCYDTPIRPDDGEIGVNLCEGMSLFETIRILLALSKSRFEGRPKTKSWTAARLSVKSERVFTVEMDGEVVQTKSAEFSVIPRAVRCCP